MTTGPSRRKGDIRRDVLALVLCCLAPVLPYLVVVLWRGVPRFDLVADIAQMEYDTRHVWKLDTLLGISGRFGWCHPGALLFYWLAPAVSMFGSSSTGMYVGTILLSCACIATAVSFARTFGGMAHGAAIALVILGWLAAFGNSTPNPWPRVVVALPLLAFLVCAASLAIGESIAAAPAVFFGTMADQTHLACLTTFAIVGGLALASFFAVRSRRFSITRRDWQWLALALVLLVVFFIPPVYEELRAPPGTGNMTKIYQFFVHREEPYKSWGAAIRNWVTATGWLPERVWGRSLVDDGSISFSMRWDAIPQEPTTAAWAIAGVHVGAVVAAAVVAFRRRDRASLALLVAGGVGDALAVHGSHAIIGEDLYSLFFWTTAASCVAWAGVLSTFFGAIGARWPAAVEAGGRRGRLIFVALAVSAALCTVAQCQWLARFPFAPASDPGRSDERRRIYEALTELGKDGATPVIHVEGWWGVAFSMLLEFEKDHADVRVADENIWGFPGSRSAAGVVHARHIWFANPDWPLRLAGCLDRVATFGSLTAYVAPTNVPSCDRPAP